LQEVGRVAREKGIVGPGETVRAEDVVFLDDIGTNVKAARKMGMRTIKVVLGQSRKAVEELEREVGMDLLGQAAGSRL
jgi:methionine salvage enolase-phosphatase E1